MDVCLKVNYILGMNPRNISYLVGFGSSFPQQVHHRGASIPSIKVHPQLVSCSGGFTTYYSSPNPNPNVHNGALVAGPDQNDNFQDIRSNYSMTEPSTYNTAPLVGVLARLAAAAGSNSSEGAPIITLAIYNVLKKATSFKVQRTELYQYVLLSPVAVDSKAIALDLRHRLPNLQQLGPNFGSWSAPSQCLQKNSSISDFVNKPNVRKFSNQCISSCKSYWASNNANDLCLGLPLEFTKLIVVKFFHM